MRPPLKVFTILFITDSSKCEVTRFLRHHTKNFLLAQTKEEAQELLSKEQVDIVIVWHKEAIDILRALPKREVFTLLITKKECETLFEAINLGVRRVLEEPVELKKLKEVLDHFESELFIKRAKEYNNFMLHQYKNAIDSSNIVSKTDINGIITYVNEEFCKISGYSKEELIGKNHNIVRHPDVPKEKFEHFWKTILAKKIWKGTVKNRAKDGKTFYVNTTVIPIIDWKGDIAEFVAIRYDVTKSVQLQEKLQKKEKELEALNKELERRVEQKTKELLELNRTLEERVNKEVEKNRQKDRLMFQQARLAALGEMLGNIAHQWRQPLMELGILFYKLKKSPQSIDEVYSKGTAILDRMSQTIVDFQNFFSPTKQKESFAILETIQNTLSIMEGSLKRNGIEVRIKAKRDVEVYGYKNEFSQVILNILANAKDALVEHNIQEPKITIKVCGIKDEAKVEIYDNGGGIDEAIMEKIFEPYFTTKGAKKGTGMGLYMSKMIIEESMKGELKASNYKDGAKFTIKIPLKV